jgi:hypothetical protein
LADDYSGAAINTAFAYALYGRADTVLETRRAPCGMAQHCFVMLAKRLAQTDVGS